MILRNNLASSPTKNYSLYLIGCVVLACLAAVFTGYNVISMTNWFSQNRTVERQISEKQKEMSQLKREEQQLRNHIVAVKTPDFIRKADFINTAIKRRVFSWTKLFDQFEKAFPDNVKMISVTPTIGEDKIQINMAVAGRSLNDIVRLITILENSPAFADVTFRSEQSGQDGLLHAGITLRYLPENASAQSQPTVQQTSVSDGSVDQSAAADNSDDEEDSQ